MKVDRVKVRVNGSERELEPGATVSDVLVGLDLRPEVVAVERNRELIPRSSHASVQLADGDDLEIVTLVGGG